MKALGIAHFRRPSRTVLAALPEMAKFGTSLAAACQSGFTSLRAGPWRVAFDGLSESNSFPSAADSKLLRYESDQGSITFQMAFDRQVLSALAEAAMGGTGTESAFDAGDRPPSRIETGLRRLAEAAIASQITSALGAQFGRSFSYFEDTDIPDLAASASGFAHFAFVVNVFTYGGELRLTVSRDDLERHISPARGEGSADAAQRDLLQQALGQSDVTLTVALATEMLSFEAISQLKPGSLIELAASVTSPVVIWSGDVAAYEGLLARSGNRLAVTLTAART